MLTEGLNDRQLEAVQYTDGPLLILAGAGSGKTRVLTHRIAYLISEKGVSPWNIMAITFTNKAAAEMRERVDKIVGDDADQIWVATFHSSCVRILRRFIDRLGYDTSFTIYDEDDRKTLIKNIFKDLNIDTHMLKEKNAMRVISSCKDELINPDQYEKEACDYREQQIAKVYREYELRKKKSNALDFDDLIVKTVELFQQHEDVLEYWQNRFKYIMIDEYQDTNNAQFMLAWLLAKKYMNICVVGDDDQSIYKFRGANIENILSFEKAFAGAKVIKLEQNYRSSGNILEAANSVIRHNRGRKDKTLWTSKQKGNRIKLYQYQNAIDEADGVIHDIKDECDERSYSDIAILYRTNAQSRLLEERCVTLQIPYQLIGGVNFYQRREIKDILAYLKMIANGKDDVSLNRIINVPKRGIGATSLEKIHTYAISNDMSMFDACRCADQIPGLGKTAEKIRKFADMITDYRDKLHSRELTVADVIESIVNDTGYGASLAEEGEIESETRLENIGELKSKAADYEEQTLDEFLEDVALISDIDRFDESTPKITLMTLHGAKGLEFPHVYITGMEEGLFPSFMSINAEGREEIEEERRLAYVGITRAEQELTLTFARQRMVNGETMWSRASRFVEEIPDELLEKHVLESEYSKPKSYRFDDDDDDYSFGGGRPAASSSFAGNGFGRTQAYGSERDFGGGGFAVGRNNKPANGFAVKPAMNTFGKEFKVEKSDHLDYGVGDRVSHIKFGEGTVKEIKEGKRDFEVLVEFDEAGERNLLAGFAKLQKL